MTVCADATVWTDTTTNNAKIAVMKPRLVMALFSASVHHQWQHTGFCLFSLAAAPPRTGTGIGHQVGQRCVFQDLGGRIPHVKEHLVECAVVGIPSDKTPQLFSVAERRQRTVNQTNDFAQPDLRGRATQLVSTLGTPSAFHDP